FFHSSAPPRDLHSFPTRRSSDLTLPPMAGIEPLVEELERSYADLQARLSDPAVYNDHREAAEVGRRLKELETPHKLAVAWQDARSEERRVGKEGRCRRWRVR